MKQGITLAICTYNGKRLLIDTIPFILKQRISKHIEWEVLFIDNASTDNTHEAIKKLWGDNSIPMRIIAEPKKGLINARKRALNEAAYSIVSFIDDDNWIEENWIEKVYEVFNSNLKIGVCGSYNKAFYEKQPPTWFKWIEQSFAVGRQGEISGDITESRGYVWGAGLSLRADVYKKMVAAGFATILTGRTGNELLAGEDTELCYAFVLAGYKIYYNEQMQLTHFIPSKRLHWQKIVSMYRGFGKAHAVLQLYVGIIQKESLLQLFVRNWREYINAKRKRNYTKKKTINEGDGDYLNFVFQQNRFNGSMKLSITILNWRKIKRFYKKMNN